MTAIILSIPVINALNLIAALQNAIGIVFARVEIGDVAVIASSVDALKIWSNKKKEGL